MMPTTTAGWNSVNVETEPQMEMTSLSPRKGPHSVEGTTLKSKQPVTIICLRMVIVNTGAPCHDIDREDEGSDQGEERGDHEDGLALCGAPGTPRHAAVKVKTELKANMERVPRGLTLRSTLIN